MLNSVDILTTLDQLEDKRKRLQLTNNDVKTAMGIHLNTFMNWKADGFAKMQVCDLMNYIDFLNEVDTVGKTAAMSKFEEVCRV